MGCAKSEREGALAIHFEQARPTTLTDGANSTLILELIASECPWLHDRLQCEPFSDMAKA